LKFKAMKHGVMEALDEIDEEEELYLTKVVEEGATPAVPQKIKQIKPSESLATLGVRTAVLGGQADELKIKKKQAETFSARVEAAPMKL
jgi:hypothetical protein